MKLLLSDKELGKVEFVDCDNCPNTDDRVSCRACDGVVVAQAQLDKIFNLDIKTTVELIEKLRQRLDNLLEREMAK